jgi:tetratricopeptide (TPR) repeat protein
MNNLSRWAALAGVAASAACAPHIRTLETVMDNGEVLHPTTEQTIERARAEGETQRDGLAQQRGAVTSAALASCAAEVCDAIARGELSLGMTEEQVFAATRTTPQAWELRGNGGAMLMTARSDLDVPADAMAKIALVSLQNGRVASYTYQEPTGFRTVASRADATFAGRSAAQADALLRQGDALVASGKLELALERYDQADILRPNHAETTLRIARTLDKSLRPIEAIMRYQMFIHQMELERIRAEGDVAAKIAESIALAHERIIVLEKR